MKYGAVIVAAGMSKRMGEFKPLLKINGMTMISRVITTFKEAGVADIVVVTGYRADELENEIKKYGVSCIRNENYGTTQMFDSVKMGLEYMQSRCDGVLFAPADVPLFSLAITKLVKNTEQGDIRIPVCKGRDGHPVFIKTEVLPQVLAYDGDRGLKGALEVEGADILRLEVDNPGIYMDADTPEDFAKLVEHYKKSEALFHKTLCIFGAGQAGRMARAWRDKKYDLVGFIDNKKELWGIEIEGTIVLSPQEAVDKNPDEIWLAIINKEAEAEIEQQLLTLGYTGKIRKLSDVRGLADMRVASLRLYADQIRKRGVAGAVAELGVYKGDFSYEMSRLFPERKLYLFDTFEGFKEKDVLVEKENSYSKAECGKFSDTDAEAVRNRMENPARVIIRKGYFPETAEGIDETFALVSIDPDLYGPTLEGLKFFYPRMAQGGCIFIHDYNSCQFMGVKAAVDEYCEANGIYVFPLTDLHGTAVIIK